MYIWIIQFFISGVAGFFISRYFSGNDEGKDGKLFSFRWKIGNYTLWLHHWIFSAVGLFILYNLEFYNPIVYGILFGMLIQGLYYKDYYYIFFKTKNYPFKKL